jgi:hypothetical protein
LSSVLDELVGNDEEKPTNKTRYMDRPNVIYSIPFEGTLTKILQSIDVTTKFDFKVRANKRIIKSKISYDDSSNEIEVNWEETCNNVLTKIKEMIPDNKFALIKEPLNVTLNQHKDNIRAFITCITFNRGLNSLVEFIKTPDESDEENDYNEDSKQKRKEFFTYKYTSNKHIYEAILVAGKPYFMTFYDGQLELVDQIEQDTRILRPPHEEDYIYKPLSFESENEIEKFIQMVSTLSIDDLFWKTNGLISRFIVHHQHVIGYYTGLIMFSYFQDRFPTVPYTMFVADNGSGKSSIGDIFEMLGYRCVNMTDPTTANVYRIFGNIEAGQCTLVLDEAEKIDSNEIMSILKSGYERGKVITRTNNQTGKQEHFHAFGIKIMLAERTPHPSKAKGVLDRTFIISNFKGIPELDIKEIKNAEHGRQLGIKQELEFLRKTIMIYRLIHFNYPYPNINIGLEGRDKELCKPLLQVFYGNNSSEHVERALERLIDEKHERKANSLEREALEVIGSLFEEYPDGFIPFYKIWDSLTEKLDGQGNPYKSNQMETEMYGTIYRETFSKMIRDRFGAKNPATRDANVRILSFDVDKTKKYLESYTKDTGPTKIVCSSVKYDSSDSKSESLFDTFWNKDNLGTNKLNSASNQVLDTSHLNESKPEMKTSNSPFDAPKDVNTLKLKEYDNSDQELDNLKESVIREIEKLEGKEEKIDGYNNHKLVKHIKVISAVIDKEIVQTDGSTVKITREMMERVINKLMKEGILVEPKKGYYCRTTNTCRESAATAAA